jgi:hypothetical protein
MARLVNCLFQNNFWIFNANTYNITIYFVLRWRVCFETAKQDQDKKQGIPHQICFEEANH